MYKRQTRQKGGVCCTQGISGLLKVRETGNVREESNFPFFENLFFFSCLLQQQLPILIEEEDAEGTMQHTPRCARDKAVRQVLVHVSHDLVVFVQCDHLFKDDRRRNERLLVLRIVLCKRNRGSWP